MNNSKKIARLLCYIYFLYQLWHLCQYGGIRSHLPRLIVSLAGCGMFFVLWVISRKNKQEEASENRKNIVLIEILLFFIVTAYFAGQIIYSAIPYNGALAWKIDDWMRKRDVKLEHNNIFKDGAAGILMDLDRVVGLPDELYLVNQCQITFDQDGIIRTIYIFMYGRDESETTHTYLVDYDAKKSRNMRVSVDGEANPDYDGNMRLSPMLRILERADYEKKVKEWSKNSESDLYEILYLGKRSFETKEGLVYLPGDVDGDGVDSEDGYLNIDGRIVGFEVSLHIPGKELTPVRYIMEPEYISQDELIKEREQESTEEAKDTAGWTVDEADGTMYFFLNDDRGWQLEVTDAAAGSRFYGLERTVNGGSSWEDVNGNPFEGNLGVAEGLVFFDEKFGFAGLSGASQTHSQLYVTRDGGETFESVQLPMDTVTELPEHSAQYGFALEDYDYCHMPEEEDGVLTIKVTSDVWESEGMLFESRDEGRTWRFASVVQ